MLIKAVHTILDFAYLAQYPVHSINTLDAMINAIQRFYVNKQVFIELGI